MSRAAPADFSTDDVLTSGRRDPGAAVVSRAASWLRARRTAVVLVLAIIGVVVAADLWQQHREHAALTAFAAESEGALAYADSYLAATVEYWGPALYAEDPPEALLRGYRTDLREAAQAAERRVAGLEEQLAALRILPWHAELEGARALYASRLAEWRAYAAAVASDSNALFDGSERRRALADEAAAALADARPWA